MEELKGIILGAGYGERMRPITNFIPKPLLPVSEKTNIDIIIERMLEIRIKRIGVNVCHLKGKMKHHLETYDERIFISEEERILGTGGGIRRIAEKLNADSYLIHNGDIYTEVDLMKVIEKHKKSSYPMTMVVRPGGHDLDLVDGRVDFTGIGFTYCGVGVMSRDLAIKLQRDLISSVSDQKIRGFIYEGTWFDLGSPAGYLSCIRHTKGYIAPDADLEGTEIEGYCYVGSGVRLRKGRIKNAVILPGTVLSDGARITDGIIAPGSFINC